MTQMNILLAIILTASIPAAQAGFGAAFQLWMQQPYKTSYRKFTVTLKVPPVPTSPKDFVLIWPGIHTDKVLFQPELWSFENNTQWCGAKANQWCAVASYLDSKVHYDKWVPVSPGETLIMEVANIGTDQGYSQSIKRDGKIISSISGGAGGGLGRVFYTEVECQKKAKEVGPAHTYTNLTLTLGQSDPDFAKTVSRGLYNASSTPLYTTDGGLTWKVDTINMKAALCTPP